MKNYVYLPGLSKTIRDEETQTVIKPLLQLYSSSNIILIDWSASYPTAEGAKVMFKEADIILENLLTAGFKPKNTHVIGFGIATSLAGYIAKYFKNSSLLLARVTGLNPNNLNFAPFLAEYEIKRSDAKFVDVIHTDEIFGKSTVNGHADFWPNGGKNQIGCGSVFDSELKSALNFTNLMQIFQFTAVIIELGRFLLSQSLKSHRISLWHIHVHPRLQPSTLLAVRLNLQSQWDFSLTSQPLSEILMQLSITS